MDTSKIASWLAQGPSAEDVPLLREYVERYPYAGPLRMLLAKASERAQDFGRREDLLKAGAHVPSRRALFTYCMGPGLVQAAQAVHTEVLAAPDVSEEELVGLIWHDQTSNPSPVTFSSEQGLDETAQADPAEEADAEVNSPHVASRDAMVAAIASVIEQDVSSWNVDSKASTDAERPQEVDVSSPKQAAPKAATHQAPRTPEVVTVAKPISLFGQWLQQRALETGFGTEKEVEQGATALIDAFLAKGDVRLGPVRDGLATTEDWAKQSLVEDPSLVTETMAKLYAQQGQIGRARKAYKLLALKYPEKSVYFAAQLKKLRNS